MCGEPGEEMGEGVKGVELKP
jgi:hypothetical protein